MISWLREQTDYPKVYWRSKEEEIVACGIQEKAEAPPLNPKEAWFGIFSFDSQESPFFFSPRLIHRNRTSPTEKTSLLPKPCSRQDFPNFKEWVEVVEEALRRIDEGCFSKVVLGRKTQFDFDHVIDPWSLLSTHPNCTTFLFQSSAEETFLGITPETLYQRSHLQFSAEAVAGTRPRGKTAEEDLALKQALLSGEKERREFTYVQEFIEHVVAPFSQAFSWSDLDVIQTRSVQHLHRRFSAVLHPDIDDAHLLQALHPTPALCGFPRKEAFSYLKSVEPWKRHWYGSPLGWVFPGGAHFVVAIRSLFLKQNKAHLLTAAGIVKESNPSLEWEELESKMKTWISL